MARPAPDPVYVLRGSTSSVNVVKFAPKCVTDNGLVAAGSSSGIVSLWNLKTRRVQTSFDAHNGQGILEMGITCEAKLISHGRDGSINIWDISRSSPQAVSKIVAPVFGFCKFSLLKRGKNDWLATATAEQSQIKILDLDSQEIIHSIKPDAEKSLGMCMCVRLFNCITTGYPMLLAGYEDGGILLWDVTAGKMLSHLMVHSEAVMCMDVDELHCKAVTGSADNKLKVTSLGSVGALVHHSEVELKSEGLAAVKLRNDAKVLASGSWAGRIRIYDWKKLKVLAILNYHTDTVNTIDFSEELPSSGVLLAAGSKDCRISLWSLYNNKQNAS